MQKNVQTICMLIFLILKSKQRALENYLGKISVGNSGKITNLETHKKNQRENSHSSHTKNIIYVIL